MNPVVVISSDEDDSGSIRKVSSKKNTSKKSSKKLKNNSSINFKSSVNKGYIRGTVVLNEDGDDEEFQLDIHTKTREELEAQKSSIPRPLSPTGVVDRPLPKLMPKPIETDVILSEASNNIPRPLLPSLTITPINKSNDSQSVPYLKVKNIEALKKNTTDQFEINSTLEINQSTNLFILNSDNNSSSILQEALQKLSNQQTDVIVSKTPSTPLFKITNVHTLAKTANATISKRKCVDDKSTKSKRIKLNNKSEIISLIDNEKSMNRPILLESDSEDDTTTKNIDNSIRRDSNDGKDSVSNLTMPIDENNDDVICIENTIDKIDICSSSDSDSDILKNDESEMSKKVNSLQLEKMKEKLSDELNESKKINNTEKIQNNGKTEQLLTPQNHLDEFQNTKTTSESQKNTEIEQSHQNELQSENTMNDELQNTEKALAIQQRIEEVKLSKISNTENFKKTEVLQNTSKTELPNDENIGLSQTDQIINLENNEKIVSQTIQKSNELHNEETTEELQNTKNTSDNAMIISLETLQELQNTTNTLNNEIQNNEIDIQMHNTEKTLKTQNATNSSQINPSSCIIIENVEDPKNPNENIEGDNFNEIDGHNIFEKFLETCTSESVPTKCHFIINKGIGKIRKRFDQANIDYLNSNNFKQLINKKIRDILIAPITATVAFSEILMELKNNKQENYHDINSINKETLVKIKKLEAVLKILDKKIRQLEQTEMSLDDVWDENAAYLQEERYKRKSCQIYKKLCELQKKDPNAGRLTLMKINFQGSKYSKVNDAINKLYNKKRQFPNLYDIKKCIKKCAERYKFKLTENQIDDEAREMFRLLGNKLQRRRKKETYENLMSYPNEVVLDDPASKDVELEKKLRESHKEANTRIEEIMNKFVQKQNLGEDTCLNDENSDSEKSDSSTSDSDRDNEDELNT